MIRAVSLFIFLFIFWLLLSGFFTPFLVAAGVGCSLAIVWFSKRMEQVDKERMPLHMVRVVTTYWYWLLMEIVKCGWSVSKIILDPKLPISPTLVRFVPTQKTKSGLVLHANSITLTPGTIAIEAEGKGFLVHGLTHDSAHGCVDSEMDQRVSATEGRA